MKEKFKFKDEIKENLYELAWRNPPDELFDDEERIKRFIVKIEDAINDYPAYCEMPTVTESREKLETARETVQKLYEQLLCPGDTLMYLHNAVAYLNVSALMPPKPTELAESLVRIGILIDLQLDLIRGQREKKVPEAVHRLITILVCRYFFEFEKLPAIANKKLPTRTLERPLQSTFNYFVDCALDALVEQGHLQKKPTSIKYLTKNAVDCAPSAPMEQI